MPTASTACLRLSMFGSARPRFNTSHAATFGWAIAATAQTASAQTLRHTTHLAVIGVPPGRAFMQLACQNYFNFRAKKSAVAP